MENLGACLPKVSFLDCGPAAPDSLGSDMGEKCGGSETWTYSCKGVETTIFLVLFG